MKSKAKPVRAFDPLPPLPNAPRLLSTKELARFLGIRTATIFQWRHRGIAPIQPVLLKVGQRTFLRWRMSDALRLVAGEGAGDVG